MPNPFDNSELRDWFFNCFNLSDFGVVNAITTGSGPFDEEDFDTFLKKNEINPCIPLAEVNIMIVGTHDWDEKVITESLRLNKNKQLKVYSQEMFLSYMYCGVDPYESEFSVLQLFAKEHSAFKFLFSYGFKWPSTFVSNNSSQNDLIAKWLQKGFLGYLGYKVGRSGLSSIKRIRILEKAFTNQLPSELPLVYRDEWGNPNSSQRLLKIANSIASFCRNAKNRNNRSYDIAIYDWEADLDWLKNEYYKPFRNNFRWPETD
jgi:hypothetical protein